MSFVFSVVLSSFTKSAKGFTAKTPRLRVLRTGVFCSLHLSSHPTSDFLVRDLGPRKSGVLWTRMTNDRLIFEYPKTKQIWSTPVFSSLPLPTPMPLRSLKDTGLYEREVWQLVSSMNIGSGVAHPSSKGTLRVILHNPRYPRNG